MRALFLSVLSCVGLGFAASAGGLPAGSAWAQETITVRHAQGEAHVPAAPQTVLVFDVASLDTLDALGVPVKGVPSGRFPAHLARYEGDEYEKIGSLFEADMEAVNAAEPDLIIVGGRSAPQYDALSGIAPTIDLTVDQGNFIASTKGNVRTLAEIFGKTEEAETKLATLDASVAALKEKAAEAGNVLVVLTTGNRMSAYGKGSRFGVVHDGYGFAAADENLGTANHGEAISFEYIAQTNPDWLFVIDRDAAIGQGAAAAMLDNELVAGTTAWKSGQVVYLNSASWYLVGGGLTAMQANADQVAEALAGRD